jgi:hypothetical protein
MKYIALLCEISDHITLFIYLLFYIYHCGYVGLKLTVQHDVQNRVSCCSFLVSGVFVIECVAH